MPPPIIYRVNYNKAVEALVWIADQKPGVDIYHVAKVFFYADKKHVNRYARPILGHCCPRLKRQSQLTGRRLKGRSIFRPVQPVT